MPSSSARASSSVLRRGADHDVHAPDSIDLVVVDLGEHDVLLDAERVVAAAVEALRVQAAEVAHARQRDVDQPVEELVHAVLRSVTLAPIGMFSRSLNVAIDLRAW